MLASNLHSIKQIEKQYNTGESPVLVVCSDKDSYICKYMRSTSAAYKLASEHIGAQMIQEWKIASPTAAMVNIKAEHWNAGIVTTRNLSAPAIGYRKLDGVIDVTPTTYNLVSPSKDLLEQLLRIALFDFWIANEDRTYNNANLLYDVQNEELVSIDYGGILNTSIFEYPMSQLTSTDTILYADIFHHLSQGKDPQDIWKFVDELHNYYHECIERCANRIGDIKEQIPKEWNIPMALVEEKLNQLFDTLWVDSVWENFVECLTENLENE